MRRCESSLSTKDPSAFPIVMGKGVPAIGNLSINLGVGGWTWCLLDLREAFGIGINLSHLNVSEFADLMLALLSC